MAIRLQSLREAAQRAPQARRYKSMLEAQADSAQTAFLSHSHEDRELALGLQVRCQEEGWKIYVDWQDTAMPAIPSRETAELIKSRIRQLTWFLFLATPHSMASKWCPWEIGFADSAKPANRILIVPTSDKSDRWYGSEYLRLYSKIDDAKGGGLALFEAGAQQGTWIRSL